MSRNSPVGTHQQPDDFPTNPEVILERIAQIDPLQYAKTRNFISGAVTHLSPFISRGYISGKQIMNDVLQRGYKPYQIQKFLQELAWREYFQRVWQHVGDNIWSDLKQPQSPVEHRMMVDAISNSSTGIEAIDQAIERLYSNGYMHNHIRMYVASITCNMAKAHWSEPSRWLYYHLLDGDIASNNCNWQWIAGAFSSKKYIFNQQNVNKYCNTTQQGTFVDKEYADIAAMPVPDVLQGTSRLSLHTILPKDHIAEIDVNKPTLIYNSYNLDKAWRIGEDVNRVLLLEPSHFNKYPVSSKVIEFVIDLSKNITDLQLHVGEIDDIAGRYEQAGKSPDQQIISKEHPAFTHYPGIKDSRDWMFPEVTGYYKSFFSFWKQCEKQLK